MLCLMREVDEEERRTHAESVVRDQGLDSRLAELIPLRPRRRKQVHAYDRLMTAFENISQLGEPERTKIIDELRTIREEREQASG